MPNWTPALGLLAWLFLLLLLARVALRGPAAADEAALAELAELIFSFVPLVVVPLVLPLTALRDRSRGTGPQSSRTLTIAHAVGATAVLIGATQPTGGPLALVLAGLWLGFTALAGLHGLTRLVRRSRLQLAELAIDLGLLILPVAGVWLLAYRGELVLAGFGGLAALLTAAHFHAAGFGTLVMTGLLGRGLADADMPRARRLHAVITPLVMLAFPLLAAGIGGAIRPLELAGAGLYALALPLLAGLQIGAAIRLRGRPVIWRIALVISALAVVLATVFAARFAVQGFYGAAVPISTMLRWHAAVNMLGFLGLGLLAWSRLRPPPLAGPTGLPVSRLRSRGRVGAEFFASHTPGPGPAPTGLLDALADLDRPGFVAAAVAPGVRGFYEQTARHDLAVTPHWRFPFRLAGRLSHTLGRVVGQMTLPLATTAPLTMPSRIVPVDAAIDGRPGVRGWVRTLGPGGPPVYVAAYATHRDPAGMAYMNIAFPLPGSNLASVLRIDHDPARPGGLVLTTCSMGQDDTGDQGIYLVTPLGPLRVPMNETLWVWPEPAGAATPLRARHRIWLFGLPCVDLDYAISAPD